MAIVGGQSFNYNVGGEVKTIDLLPHTDLYNRTVNDSIKSIADSISKLSSSFSTPSFGGEQNDSFKGLIYAEYPLNMASNLTANATLTFSNEGILLYASSSLYVSINPLGLSAIGGTLLGSFIYGGTITGAYIFGSSISGTTISGGTIFGGTIIGGSISGSSISGGSIYIGTPVGGVFPFQVVPDGSMTSTSGQIGGWTIAPNSLSSGTTQLNSAGTIRIRSGNNFYVDSNGNVTANNIALSGSITSQSGRIGGWLIGVSGLSSVSNNVILDTAGRIDVGPVTGTYLSIDGVNQRIQSSNFIDSNATPQGFELSTNGTLKAVDGYFKGKLSTNVFEKNKVNVVGGNLVFANSARLSTSRTTGNTTFEVEDTSEFAVDDVIKVGGHSELIRILTIPSPTSFTVTRARLGTVAEAVSGKEIAYKLGTWGTSAGFVEIQGANQLIQVFTTTSNTAANTYTATTQMQLGLLTLGQFAGTYGMYATGNIEIEGVIKARSGYFSGAITSTSGFIGGWSIGANSLSSGTTFLNSTGTVRIRSGNNFYVDSNGNVTANNVSLSGSISAVNGYIGNSVNAIEISPTALIFSTQGRLYSTGKTSFSGSTAGFWLGYDTTKSDYTFGLGSGAKYFRYNGTDISTSGGLFTGGVFQTAETGRRVVLSGADSSLKFYDTNNDLILYLTDNAITDNPGIVTENGQITFNMTSSAARSALTIGYGESVNSSSNMNLFYINSATKFGVGNFKRTGQLTGIKSIVYNIPDSSAYSNVSHYGIYSTIDTVVRRTAFVNPYIAAVYGGAVNSDGSASASPAYSGYFDDGLFLVNGIATFNSAVYMTNNLSVTGSISAGGDIIAYVTSDQKFKNNIQPLKVKANILNLTPVSFVWTGFKENDMRYSWNGQPDIGFIAQDVQKYFPHIVKERQDKSLAIDYIKMFPLVVDKMKHQDKEIKELKTLVKTLIKRMDI